jgi:two-component system response regulator WspF
MRVAIVNDLALAVEAIRRVLLRSHAHELAWIARTGIEAVEHCAKDTPDLILMDLIMPGMDGVEATRRIMAESPCAIVVATADMDRNISKVFEAMGAGALDAVNTPTWEHPDSAKTADILLRKIQTINQLLGGKTAKRPPVQNPPAFSLTQRPALIAIGASAGGPAALAMIFSQLPENLAAAIVVVQHVDSQFAAGLAEWLDQQTRLPVRLAREGERPQPAEILLAGMEEHLVFIGPGRLGYSGEPFDASYHPSIDIFFQSVQKHWHGDVIGVLLTGMGADGAEGLKALRLAGHHTIAQDRESSAVYGMPKAAIEINGASEILPLERIGPRLINLLIQKIEQHA